MTVRILTTQRSARRAAQCPCVDTAEPPPPAEEPDAGRRRTIVQRPFRGPRHAWLDHVDTVTGWT